MIKPKHIIYALIYGAVILSGISYFNNSRERRKEILSDLSREYPQVIIRDSLNDYVAQIHHPYITEINNHPHQAYVTFTSGKKYSIRVGLELGEKKLTLDEVLSPGDHVIKKVGSNRIDIFKLDSVGNSLEFNFGVPDSLGDTVK